VDVIAENSKFLSILREIPDLAINEIDTDGSKCAPKTIVITMVVTYHRHNHHCYFTCFARFASSLFGRSGISFVEWQMAGQRYFKKALVVSVR
jgi:hypothetical protein